MAKLGEINHYAGSTVNPMLTPNQMYELYSVPSYDFDYPEIAAGNMIGSSKVTVQEDDVLICKINPRINRVWVVKHNTTYPLLASSEWIVVRSPENNSAYLKYYFSSEKFKRLLVSQVTGIGGSLTRAQPKQVATYPVPLTSYANQLRIATELDKVTALISLRKQQLAKLDELVKSQFVGMFGDVVNNEKEWETTTLDKVAEIRIGPFGTMLHKEDYIPNGHALVNPSHIHEGQIIVDNELTVSDEKYEELSAYKLQLGDIVLGRRGEMGRCAVVYQEGLLCGTGSMIVRPNHIMMPYFLQSIIASPAYKKIIEDKSVGVTMMNLNVPIVSKLSIPLLPQELQKRFVSYMNQSDKCKLSVQRSLDELITLKKALMQKHFE